MLYLCVAVPCREEDPTRCDSAEAAGVKVDWSHRDVRPQKKDDPSGLLLGSRGRSLAVHSCLGLGIAAVLLRLAEGRDESTAPQTEPSTRPEIFMGSGSCCCALSSSATAFGCVRLQGKAHGSRGQKESVVQ